MPIEMHPTRWGDPARASALPEATRGLVELVFPVIDRTVGDDEAVAIPTSRLPDEVVAELYGIVGARHVLTDDASRRLRTRGKSTPDLLRARAGDLSDAPDAVVRPGSHDEVQALLGVAARHRVAVVPFGGGTSVVGGLVARRDGYAGVICLDLLRMDRLLDVDPVSMTATLEPGVRGPQAEALLAEHGLTLGHFPQSFEHASIGGFAATRSSGQSSAGYGRFDAMVVGLVVATPAGTVRLGHAPASAAGPDLRQVFLGSEGAYGVITAVAVRVRALPGERRYEGWHWPSFDAGVEAMRTLAQSQLLPSVLRLSDENETALDLAHPDSIGSAGDGPSGGCLMIVGHEGTAATVSARRTAVSAVLAGLGGTSVGEEPGRRWAAGRFDAPYLRDSMLDLGVLVETLETAAHWSRLRSTYDVVSAALKASLGEPAMVLCHVSHVYETGASLYFTVAAPEGDDPLGRWTAAKRAATQAIVGVDATITHHHAVGTDHRPWLEDEIGALGVEVLRAVKHAVDPQGILNPGVLVP
ncbi:MAG TPA: FAD-binding oxidoreductase [Nocardioides sp.]|uniref:FAD-binding oxidoreductase n=1 Tax=Nocardioides sp. TaxID=35761 RepID=UPI002F3EB492